MSFEGIVKRTFINFEWVLNEVWIIFYFEQWLTFARNTRRKRHLGCPRGATPPPPPPKKNNIGRPSRGAKEPKSHETTVLASISAPRGSPDLILETFALRFRAPEPRDDDHLQFETIAIKHIPKTHGMIVGWLWVDFGLIWGWFGDDLVWVWGDFGVVLGAFWDNVGTSLRCVLVWFWTVFELIWGSFLKHFEMLLGWCWLAVGMTLKWLCRGGVSFWNDCGMILGTVLNRFWIMCESWLEWTKHVFEMHMQLKHACVIAIAIKTQVF